jgi:5S rRNA maturation endonuclease (ribonuclease M5)
MTCDEFLDRLEGVHPYAGGYKAICPAHEDRSASLGVTEGEDGVILVQCYAGCPTESVMEALDLTLADLFPGKGGQSYGDPVAVYQYTDESGILLFEACRFEGKRFRQRHTNEEGEVIWNLEGVRRVLFRLSDVITASLARETVYLCEGEKDVLSLVARGHVATCNPMGAGKWREEYNEFLQSANVIIVQDKDEPGRHHSTRVRDNLRNAGVLVTIVEAKEGKDASDHFEAGFGIEDFVPVVERARRGIVTAREMAETGKTHLRSEIGSVPEYVVPDFSFGKYALSFRQGRPYLLGGYTGDGKTTTALQIARSLCSSLVPPRVGFFSMEMSADDLRNRIISHWGLPLYLIEHPWEMSDHQKMTYRAAVEQLKEWPLEIIFDTQLGAQAICDVTRDRDYDFVFIDHIHRFSWGGERRNLESEISMLTNLALDFNIPVLTLAQFRAVRSGQGKFEKFPRPSIAEFKETSVLGEEAALAMAIWRHRTNDTTYDPSGTSELIALKNRYGATTSSFVRLDPKRMIFVPGGMTHAEPQPVDEPGSEQRAY